MIITVGGTPGSGKGTVGKLLAEKLGYSYTSMGDIWGAAAKEAGMSLNEFHEHLQQHPEYDYKLDEHQRSLGAQNNLLVDSRLGFHFIPHAFKVFLVADLEEGARRILSTKRDDEKYKSLSEAIAELRARAEHERTQYRQIYKVDHHDHSNYDLIVDTTSISAEDAVNRILETLPNN